jgi:hypothetical protein
MRERSASHALVLDDIGSATAFYVDFERYVGEVPAPRRLPIGGRIARLMMLNLRSSLSLLGIRKACAGFRNVPDAPSVAEN